MILHLEGGPCDRTAVDIREEDADLFTMTIEHMDRVPKDARPCDKAVLEAWQSWAYYSRIEGTNRARHLPLQEQ